MKINCLTVEVFRPHFGDCTNHGISSRFNQLLIACKTGPQSFDSDKQTPLNFCAIFAMETYTGPDYLYIAPAMVDENGRIAQRPDLWMYGGNIAYTSDSRLNEFTGHHYPLKIYDRCER